MRLVITGGAGFIGSHLVDYYIEKKHEVVVVDNLISGQQENIAAHDSDPGFTFIKQDVCEFRTIEGEVDLVMHLACPASPADYLKYPIETLKVMSQGTRNMLEFAKHKKAKFLLASTSEVYGDPEIHPQSEDYLGNVDVTSPRAVYDEGKRFAEALTLAYMRKHGITVDIVRIFNTYGARMRKGDGRVVPAFITTALRNQPMPIFGDGKQTRSFCYITDMVEALVKAANVEYEMPINLGNPMEYTVLELAHLIKELCGSKSEFEYLPLPPSDPKKRKPDISKAKAILNWQPEVTIEEGLKKTIKWFRRDL